MDKLWATQRDKLPITLMSSLRLYSPQWQWSESWKDADLWCIDVESDDVGEIAKLYQQFPGQKPKVIYFSEQFVPMPVSRWVFFKVPLNIRVFHRWLMANGFVTALYKNEGVAETNLDKKWKTHRFRLSYWPNITQYAEGADIMMVCSMMMHGWCEYKQLIPFNLDEGVLAQLLDDAEKEGNLQYDRQIPVMDKPAEEPRAESENLGLFKKIFSRFHR